MTELVTVPAAPTVPPFPALGDPNFNQLAYDNGSAMPGVSAGLQAIALTAFTNATVAGEKAAEAALSKAAADADAVATAADRVQTGADRTQTGLDRTAAEASRIAASKLNLGSKSSPPAVDNQGEALLAGATYYDTTLSKWRVWTGSGWGDGISAVAGVSSVNGATGIVTGIADLTTAQTLTNKTLTGYTETVYNLAGTVIAVANGTIQTKTLSANTTFTESLADGQSVILGITAGAFSITWPSVTWSKVGGSGVAPTLTSSGVNWIILWQVGGVVRGSFMGTA